MGSSIQKIFQGRGGKKGQSLWIRKALPLFFLFLAYLGFLLDLPIQKAKLWYTFNVVIILFFFLLHTLTKKQAYSVELLFSLALLLASITQAYDLKWLKAVYFPFLISTTAIYGQRTSICLLLLIPFLEIKPFINKKLYLEETTLLISLTITTAIALAIKNKLEARNLNYHDLAIEKMIDNADSIATKKSYSDEEIIQHYLGTIFNPDKEFKELLNIAKNTIFADSVNLFLISGDHLKLKSSTEDIDRIIPSNDGLVSLCFKENKPFLISDMSEQKINSGYIKREKITSLTTVPITDGKVTLGVLAADSSRYAAFNETDKNILQLFSGQIIKILQRERVYPQIYRSYSTLKILHEKSLKLLSTLNMDTIIENLIDSAHKITASKVLYFYPTPGGYRVKDCEKVIQEEKNIFRLKGTLLELAVKNRGTIYVSDTKNYRSQVAPFKIDNMTSALILPMFYDKELLGILLIVSDIPDAFNIHQREILEVLSNQASISILNAKLHSEIERLALTDGLTGLFNHRHFQEKLSQEFNRLERFPEPLSLLIIDIDYFKKVNDIYGHQTGDQVLKKVANIIKKTIRNIDVPARYGGEEFAVILLGTNEKGGMKIAERLRKAVMNSKFYANDKEFSITISIGLSSYTKDIRNKEELIERADKALYQAKNLGRNRCISYEEQRIT